MKKIFFTLMMCIVIVLTITVITRSDFLYDNLVKETNIEEININELEISNSTYWYDTLTKEQQRIYRVIVNGVINLDKSINIDIVKDKKFEYINKDIEIALNAFFADHPEIFYIKDKYEVTMVNFIAIKMVILKLDYISEDKYEIENMKQNLVAEIEKISSMIVNAKNEYEKELIIHDILGKEITYYEHENYDDIPSIKHTAYSALVDKSAVCDGITKAFQLVLNKSGVDSIFVTGISEGVPHAWCKVKLDGDYYNVDLTSDKTLNKENKELIIHSYFNITDKEIMNTHEFDNYDKLPKSEEKKYNYYTYEDYEISYIDNFEYKLNQIIKSQKSRGLLEFKVIGIDNVPQKMVEGLYNLNFNNYKARNITSIEYNQINDNYIVVK